ncbi:MAG: SoxR reducing system RseC family protein [Deltaproteobacteria bacterium]|nr:SoxR reducing system RseC family protein [Deltaproteobacteria bacterium]MBW2344202.1 SoxR reducing system RseC family protein [Deltaproteobacteria bacterium]
MITEQGVVEEIVQQKAVVRIQKGSACAGCESRGSCMAMEDKTMRAEVDNELQANVGDIVELGMPSGSLIKLSLLVYFFPVIAFVAGAFITAAWAESLHIDSTTASLIGGFVAMAITFFVLKWLNRGAQDSGEYSPRMTRILAKAEHPQTEPPG